MNENNAPYRIDDDPFIGQVNQEYRNSADVVDKPVIPTEGPRKQVYEDALAAEERTTVPNSVYGVAPYEQDEDGNKVEVERMGDRPPRVVRITVPTGTTAGTWLLRVAGVDTAALAYNITAGALKTAIEGLSLVGAGKVESVTGGGVGTAYVVSLDSSITGPVLANGAGLTPAGTVTVA